MTPQEAIKNLKESIVAETNRVLISDGGKKDKKRNIAALQIAISALEKQIPKHPLKTHGGAYRCPNCQMKHFDPDWIGTKHCDCGQALDWD